MTLGSARQGGIGWGPSHAPGFFTHGTLSSRQNAAHIFSPVLFARDG